MSIVSNILKQTFNVAVLALLSLSLFSLFAQIPANAQNQGVLPGTRDVCDVPTGNVGGGAGANADNGRCLVIGGNETSLPALAGTIAQFITFVVASIAVIFIVYGAFVWMTDSEKGAEKGRKIIINSVIALVVSVLAFGITQTIINVLNNTSISN